MLESFVNLNQTQLEAVTATEVYIRVIAGAGSGKTRALTHRFAFLVNEVGILPGNILCVTFTNKAADINYSVERYIYRWYFLIFCIIRAE